MENLERDRPHLRGLQQPGRGARILKPVEQRPWQCKDFYAEDIDGYILCFSEPTD